ncbi:MAG TPA: hypothetical protein VN132_14185, partial [Bdellovibrio sp.]|nr:hypothetical protein [Bdellovibrio sp.]
MPEIKNYDGKKKNHSHSQSHAHHGKAKRRPHHEAEKIKAEEANEQAADISEESDSINTEAQNEGVYAPSDVYASEDLA